MHMTVTAAVRTMAQSSLGASSRDMTISPAAAKASAELTPAFAYRAFRPGSACGARPGMIWLDIEGNGWGGNLGRNQQFIAGLASSLRAHNVSFGVYANYNAWSHIVGNWNGLSGVPLWWPYWDNNPGLGNFKSFGGWGRAAMKQYHGDTGLCGCNVDMDSY